MLGQIFSKTLLLVISTACVANADMTSGQQAQLPGYQQPGPGGSYGPQPQPPPPQQPPQPTYGHEIKSIYIGRSVRNERLSLRELAGLNNSYNGSQIIAVRGFARPDNPGRTDVQLIADGRLVSAQTNPGSQINLIPNQRLILGSTVRSLQLTVLGSTYIDQLQIEIVRGSSGPVPPPQPPYPPQPPQPPYPPQPPMPPQPPQQPYQQRVELNVYRSTVGNDRVDLGQYVNLAAYRGYAVDQVIVTGSAQYQTSFVTLLVNSFNMGQLQFNGGYSQALPIYLSQRPIIGQGADSLVLATQGNMTIEHVTLVLLYQR